MHITSSRKITSLLSSGKKILILYLCFEFLSVACDGYVLLSYSTINTIKTFQKSVRKVLCATVQLILLNNWFLSLYSGLNVTLAPVSSNWSLGSQTFSTKFRTEVAIFNIKIIVCIKAHRSLIKTGYIVWPEKAFSWFTLILCNDLIKKQCCEVLRLNRLKIFFFSQF